MCIHVSFLHSFPKNTFVYIRNRNFGLAYNKFLLTFFLTVGIEKEWISGVTLWMASYGRCKYTMPQKSCSFHIAIYYSWKDKISWIYDNVALINEANSTSYFGVQSIVFIVNIQLIIIFITKKVFNYLVGIRCFLLKVKPSNLKLQC